eukprot:scaffold300056_cov49-Prasinocladus_malaysianus.AAC.4
MQACLPRPCDTQTLNSPDDAVRDGSARGAEGCWVELGLPVTGPDWGRKPPPPPPGRKPPPGMNMSCKTRAN